MCGRYSLFVPPDELEERFSATFERAFEPRYNAAPGQELPVVTDASPSAFRYLEWGFAPPWAGEDASGQINARAETVAEKPTFRPAYRAEADGADAPAAGRCLVPADGFYEWVETDAGTQPYRVTLADGEPFAMAGLWERHVPGTTQTGLDQFGDGPPGADPDPVETFAVLTTEPNGTVADLHHRMAVVLPRGEERRWLDPAEPDGDLLRPYGGEMRAYPVSTAVNDPANDSPAVAEPIDG